VTTLQLSEAFSTDSARRLFNERLRSTTQERRDHEMLRTQNAGMPLEESVYNVDLATVGQIADLLQVPNSWIYGRTRRRGIERIPHFKLGKYLRFSRSEVLDWVQQQRGDSLAPR
jgi:excisionase family DNA binding protein